MFSAIKEICIFVLAAQAVLLFVPGDSYMKYVRILVGIMMILKITEPIFGLFLDEEKQQEIRDRVSLLVQSMEVGGRELETGEPDMEIYEEIERELKNRLNQCESGYEVLDVTFTDDRKLAITLTTKKESAQAAGDGIRVEPVVIGEGSSSERGKDGDEIRKIFEDCTGIDGDRMEIIWKE